MKKINSRLILFFYLLFFFTALNCTQYPILQKPDITAFKNKSADTDLSDSLNNGKISVGMPYYIIEEVFKNWPENLKKTKIPVASIGSRQMLKEAEGWGRVYADPSVQIFMDEYETEKGNLNVWYQFPDFYRMDVSSGDTLLIFLQDTILTSVIANLKKSRVLNIVDAFPQLSGDENLYAEIHYNDHPWRKNTCWYTVHILSDGKTFLLKDLQYEIYPIELLEFNNEPVASFNWR